MLGKSVLDRVKMRFEFLPNDPYKDREVIHIPVKQFGIPQIVVVNTPHKKQFRKDKYGYFRYLPATVRRPRRKNTAQKRNKEVCNGTAPAKG